MLNKSEIVWRTWRTIFQFADLKISIFFHHLAIFSKTATPWIVTMAFHSHGGFLQMIFLLNWEIFFWWTSEIWGIYSRHFLLQARPISSEPGQLKARRCAKKTMGCFGWWCNFKPPHERFLGFLRWETWCQIYVLFLFGASSWIHDF